MNKELLDFCKVLLNLDIEINEYGFIQHPFFSSPIIPDENKEMFYIVENPDKARSIIENVLKKSTSISELFLLLNKSYYFTFFEHAYRYMSPQEQGEFVQRMYSHIEFFGEIQSRRKNNFLNILKKIDKSYLMKDEEDKRFYDRLPDAVPIYRGVNGLNTKSGNVLKNMWKSIYWTTNREQAIWFAKRFVSEKTPVEKVLYAVTVPKDSILFAYDYEKQVCLNYCILSENEVKKIII